MLRERAVGEPGTRRAQQGDPGARACEACPRRSLESWSGVEVQGTQLGGLGVGGEL